MWCDVCDVVWCGVVGKFMVDKCTLLRHSSFITSWMQISEVNLCTLVVRTYKG